VCHRITTWDVPGFLHPPKDEKNCNRCHAVPYSHRDESFWKKIEMTHGQAMKPVPRKDCWRCHTTRNWRHLLMPHAVGNIQKSKPVQ
jgi:hypothetical protein